MHVITRTAVVVATAAVTVLASGATPAPSPSSGTVRCGATLTRSTTLTRDLVCRTADVGLRLAEGVVLDLGGHSLVGPGKGYGTAVTGGYTPTVRNGTIRGWNTGVMSEEADGGGAVSHVLVTDTRLAIGSSIGGTATVESSTLRGNDYGITTFQSTARVTDSVLRDNGTAVVVGSDYTSVSVQGSTLRGNDIAVDCQGGSASVERTRLVENGTGVRVDVWECGATVSDSTVARNEVGVSSTALELGGMNWGPVLERNVFRDNTVAVDTQSSAVVRDNDFRGNATALRSRTTTGTELVAVIEVTGNDVRRNGDGVVITGLSQIGSNTVVRNTGVGISAPGATDLGGNVAWGNGVEPQCVGVVCAGRPGV